MKHLNYESTGRGFAAGALFAFAVMLLSGCPQHAAAQNPKEKTVSGTVIDARTKQPIVGASVWIKDGTTGVSADLNGAYRITYNSDKPEILVVSFIGYDQQERVIGSSTVIDFELVESAQQIGDVVVVAFGRQKKESIVGAISSPKVKDLKLPTSQLSTSLAGQVAGVVSVQRSGEPGEGSQFWIRGISSLNSDSRAPLVLVDGIERSLDLVDVNDIESFSVLKDATATALYGVRGANGVILITTRTGDKGAPKVTLNVETGLVQPTKIPRFVNSIELADAYNSDYRINHGNDYYDAYAIDMYKSGKDPDLYPNVDWIDGLFKKLTTNQKVNASINGGGDVISYYVSGAYYHEGGIYEVDDLNKYDTNIRYNKFNFRSNVDIKVTPSTTLKVNLSTIYEVKVTPNEDMETIWKSAFIVSPNTVPMRYSNGALAVTKGSSAGSNPYNLITQSGFREYYTNNAQSLFGLTQDFSDIVTKGLVFNAKFSWDAVNTQRLNYKNEPEMFIATGRDSEGELVLERVRDGASSMGYSKSSAGSKTFYLETSLTYNRDFGKHSVGALFLFNLKSKKDVQAADINKSIPYRTQGIAGRLTYGYDNRYFIEGNFGYNGSENFSPGKRFGFFPSIAAGWMVSEEKFFEPLERVVNKLKLRASYGSVGNDNIGGNRRFIYNGTFVSEGSYMFGNGTYNTYNGLRQGDFANPSVGWEKSTKLDVGMELSLCRFVDIQASYFQDHRKGIFLEYQQMSSAWGINTAPWLNYGETKNRGFDVDVNGTRKFGEVTVSLRGNFTFNRSEVVENAEAPAVYPYRDMRGKPIGQQTGLIALGLFQSQEEIDNSPTTSGLVRVGDIKYKDVNGDGRIDENDYVPIGRTWLPEITYGFGTSVQWRNFDFSVFFQGVGNVTMFLDGPAVMPFSTGDPHMSGFYKDVYERMWTVDDPNPNAEFPRVSETKSVNNHQYRSTFWQRDVSYLRLKNATIGYSLPERFLRKIHISKARFYLSGFNLLTISKFKLFDPEVGNGIASSDGRYGGNAYPPSRIYSLGLNLTF